MAPYKELFGAIGATITLIAYAMYFRDLFFRHTKPHAFSWLLWALLGGIGYAAQVVGKAGAGSWVLGIDTIVCSIIFVLALFKGEKSYTRSDWIALFLAMFSLLLWNMTGTPVFSVILIMFVDVFAFYPTYRKSFLKPFEESVSMYLLSSLKFIFVILALENYSLITALYPGFLIFLNAGFVAMMIMWRRKK